MKIKTILVLSVIVSIVITICLSGCQNCSYKTESQSFNANMYSKVAYVCGDNPYQVVVLDDGSVKIYGKTDEAENLRDVTNGVSVSSNYFSAAIVKQDGTVVVSENKIVGTIDTSEWDNIMMVSFESEGLFGLKEDGSVLFESYQDSNITGSYWGLNKWEEINYIDASFLAVWGIKEDGTIVFGDSCSSIFSEATQDWENLKSCSVDVHTPIGLNKNGKILTTNLNSSDFEFDSQEVGGLANVHKVCYCDGCIIALKTDGTIKVIYSITAESLTRESIYGVFDNLENVVDINSYDQFVIVLLEDGNVIYAGEQK